MAIIRIVPCGFAIVTAGFLLIIVNGMGMKRNRATYDLALVESSSHRFVVFFCCNLMDKQDWH